MPKKITQEQATAIMETREPLGTFWLTDKVEGKTVIDWTDYSWNPVTGCLHGCDYCYARRMAERFGQFPCENSNCNVCGDCQLEPSYNCERYVPYETIHELNEPIYTFNPKRMQPYPFGFEPTFHKYRFDEPMKKIKGVKIFVSSMGDLFGEWVPDEWIEEVFKACQAAPQHTYMFLTKNPKRYGQLNGKNHRYDWSFAKENWWFGTTITCQDDLKRLRHLPYGHVNTFLSIEPLQSDIDLSFYLPCSNTIYECSYCGHHASHYTSHCQNCDKEGGYSGSFRKHPIDWIIIGAQTGPGAVYTESEWVYRIINQARAAEIPIFLKDNLKWTEEIKEFPKQIK